MKAVWFKLLLVSLPAVAALPAAGACSVDLPGLGDVSIDLDEGDDDDGFFEDLFGDDDD